MVSNEVGCGIVPMNAVSRLFADEQGRLNQRVATVCEKATVLAAARKAVPSKMRSVRKCFVLILYPKLILR